MSYHFLSKLIPCFFALFGDLQIRVLIQPLKSRQIVPQNTIYMQKSKFGCQQAETNQILKIEAFVVLGGSLNTCVFFLFLLTRYVITIPKLLL